MKRIEFLKKRWIESGKIDASAQVDHSVKPGDGVFDILVGADPTPRKIYADFVLRCYASREFLLEDVERIKETLAAFHSNKGRLPLELRDIGRYESERDVWDALSNAGITQLSESGKGMKRSDRNRAHLESEVVHAEGWTMATLKTPFAAQWWGMGTRWCTTEKTGRTFEHYRSSGVLRVFVSPDGVKHQLHIATASLCDATDHPVKLEEYLKVIPHVFIEAIKDDVAAVFEGVVADESTFLFRYRALLSLPSILFQGPAGDVFEKMKIAGLNAMRTVGRSQDGWELKVAAGELSTWAVLYDLGRPYESWHRNRSPMRIEEPDAPGVSVALDRTTLSTVADTVSRMPGDLREQFLSRYVRAWPTSDTELGHALEALIKQVPPKELSQNFWRLWAKKIGSYDLYMPERPAFDDIPAEASTLEIAHVFAKQGLLHRIPKTLMTDTVALALAKSNPVYVNDPEIAAKLNMRQIADALGGRNGDNLRMMHPQHRNAEMIRLVVEQCPAALGKVLSMLRSGLIDLGDIALADFMRELSLAALANRAAALSDVTIPLPRSVYLDVVGRAGEMLALVPLEYRDVELCSAAASGEHVHGLCHFPAWVVREIREANEGAHGITHNYRASARYAHVLNTVEKPTGPLAEALPPFRISDVAQVPRCRR